MTNKRTQKIIEETNVKLPLSGNLYEKNRKRISISKTFKLIFLSGISTFIVVIVIIGFLNSSRSKAESVTQDDVISQLSDQIILPKNPPINFLRVSNAETLINQDVFYKDIKNGEYIIVFDSMALIYDFSDKKIINIKTTN